METVDQIQVEVIYALPDGVFRKSLSVSAGTTLKQAVELSGVKIKHPEIDLSINKIGVYSKLRDPDSILVDGDRVEIYRDLKIDPKEARRTRAQQKGKL
ncbi:MAG: RnfH family protein [Gammaproteobacteria bacterium]|nr:RnfH family protein [Gammaproteobacteria bacterium]NIN61321.1 RnfH family protein [Gammaproteobacteria bacterium]NIO61089.1 RnfH family protein [Gammaproteobacteria bacterium]NIP48977.1 RnfH family protein [Gammaproteobacteria bacterium]NIQ09432.1 RnfH family protein [Gammaproteobacteria bacterium]